MSLASCSTSSGLIPAVPKKVTGSSLVNRPWCDMVSMRTVVPDLMRSAGGTRAETYPQTTVFGVEPNVTSGLRPAGAGCPAADDTRPAMPRTARQITATPQTCFDIGSIPSGKISAQHSIECRPRRKCAARERSPARSSNRVKRLDGRALRLGAARAGQAEDVGRARDARGGAGLDRRGADLAVAHHQEQRGEAVHAFLEQRFDRLRGDVAAGEAGAAGGDDHVDRRIQIGRAS